MARITSKQAQEMMDAYAKVYETKEEPAIETPVNETPVEDIQENIVRPSERFKRSQQTQQNLSNATKGYKFSGSMTGGLRADPVAKPQPTAQPVAKPQPTAQPVARPAAQQQQQQRPATGGQPQGGTPVNKLFGRGGSDGSPAPYTGGPNAAQRANAGTQKPVAQGGGAQQQPVKTVGGQGNRQRPVKTGGIQAGKAIRGGLSRLGSLAGKAVGAARSAAGNVAGAVAGGIKAGAKAVGGALANKGPIQGRASGPQRRAQQAQTRAAGAAAGAAAAKPAATRPVQGQQPAAKPVVSNNSPAAKAGIPLSMRQAAADKNAKFQAARKSGNMAQYRKENPKLSGADRAKAMAKARIAAKNAPAPKTPINSSYDFFDDTVQFLVSEGHAKDISEAMSIMRESEFIDAFNQELNE